MRIIRNLKKANTVIIAAAAKPSTPAPPQPILLTFPPNPTSSTSAAFIYRDTQAGVSFQCSLDSSSFKSCASTGVGYSNLAAGAHTFKVAAQSGKSDLSSSAVYQWSVVDTTPPPAPVITKRPDPATFDDNASFTYTDSESGVAFSCKLDTNAFSPCASNGITYKKLPAAQHTFTVVAFDKAGNQSAPISYTWTIAPAGTFAISGDVNKLFVPGGNQYLNLTLNNPFSYSIAVSGITVTVPHDLKRNGQVVAGCVGTDNLSVVQFAGPSTVPAHSSKTLADLGVLEQQRPNVKMLNTSANQDACKNTTFTLSYKGTATKA